MWWIGGMQELSCRADQDCGLLKIGVCSLPLSEGEGIEAMPVKNMGCRYRVTHAFSERKPLMEAGARLLIIPQIFVGPDQRLQRSD